MNTDANHHGDTKIWVQAKLEEYRALRGEITESIRAQHQVLVYGFSLIGLLTAASGQVWDKSPFVATFIYWVAIPTFSYTFLFIWLGEVEGLIRIGRYLSVIEREVNSRVPGEPMGWENYLRGRRGVAAPKMRANYKAVLFVLLSVGFVAPLVGDAASVALFNEFALDRWYSPFLTPYRVAWRIVCGVVLWNAVTTAVFVLLLSSVYKRGKALVSSNIASPT